MGDQDHVATATDRLPDPRPKPTPLWALLSRWITRLEAWVRSHGGSRLRWSVRGFWAVIGAVGALLLFGPVINPPLTLDDLLESADTATGTWIARDVDARYVFSQDEDGRLHAEVTETIVAFFPDDVSESGIVRTLVTQYEGHALLPSLIATTIDGKPTQAQLVQTPDRLTVRLDAGERLNGDHTFVVRYTLSDPAFPSVDDASGQDVDLLEWSVLGPDWAHGLAALDVTVTIPDDLDRELLRDPRGDVAWTLISGGEWLQPEGDSPAGAATYSFSIDQNLPPHSQAWFTFVFPSGTIAMPPLSPLFLLQTFGPLVPLAVLILTLLFAMAARAVAWSDARGRPWFVMQSDPPAVTPATAAQILRAARTRELAEALAVYARASGSERRRRLAEVGQVATRTGRIGDRVRAAVGLRVDKARSAQVREGYRRVPRGFVRDWFLAAPAALSVLQLGLIRQLSHQTTLAVVWWPAVFVIASLIITAVILRIALHAQPLTRKGALVRQHLEGIRVYAERTGLIARGVLTDPAMPYAVLQGEPRRTGALVRERVVDAFGSARPLSQWRTRDFVTWPRIIVRSLSVALVVGAVALVILAPNPYERGGTFASWDFGAAGSLYTQVDAVDVAATVASVDGTPQVSVVQRAEVVFDEDAPRPPQFSQKWPVRLDGQDLGFEVTSVRVDGAPVDYVLEPEDDLVELATSMTRALGGEHTVEVAYVLRSPVTAGLGSPMSGADRRAVERIRWTALLDGWEHGWTHPSTPSARLSVTVSDELSSAALAEGWLREDPDTADDASQWRDSVFPFGTLVSELGPPDSASEEHRAGYGEITETATSTDGASTHTLTSVEGDYGYPTSRTYSDLGVMLEFPEGTFDGVQVSAYRAERLYGALPVALVWISAGAAAVLALIGAATARARSSRRFPPGGLRDAVRVLPTALAASAGIVVVWASADMPADAAAFPPLLVGALVGVAAAVAGWIIIRPAESPSTSGDSNARTG